MNSTKEKEELYKMFLKEGEAIGKLLVEKNSAYGNSFNTSGEILRILYPEGVKPYQYEDLLAIARIIDKLYRISNKVNGKDQMNESPYQDIAGYGILGCVRDKLINEENIELSNIEKDNLKLTYQYKEKEK